MSTNFSPTPAELNLVSQIFAQHDPQKLGILTGDVAVRVFGGAKLPPTTLGEIWNIADEDNNGWLPKKGVAIAARLIGWAQKGEKVTQALVNKPGPLAVIDGINVLSQQSTGMSAMSLPKSPPPMSFPVLTPQDKAKFHNMFMKSGPFNGLLSGEKARDIFVKSKLSNEQLLKIWNLADTQDRGALDATDFAIGMYFIQGVMTGKISFIPTSLPPGLYQQAGGSSVPGSVTMHMTGNSASGSFSPVSSVFNPQHTGQTPSILQPNHTGQPFKAPALPARPSGALSSNGHPSDWDVTAAEKASADRFFDTLDTQKNGYIEGEVAVPFMLKSNLPGEVLAQVWDLADMNNDGRLTRDGFAVAMHLIQKKLAGQPIPDILPPSLVPPSARHTPFGDSPFQYQAPKQPEAPVQDLFSFDDTPPQSAVSPPLQPAHTGGIQPNITGSNFGAVPPIPARKPQPEADPFSSATFKPAQSQDFFGDDDTHPVSSPPLHDQSAEIGNVKNQLTSTERSLATTRAERESVEQALANQASQLSSMQTQLSSAKAAYETETKLLATLKERRATQLSEIEKTRSDLISAESNLSALRAEKAEIEGAFLRDKEEARDLHKRMVEAGQQAEALKADVEKLKKEAKQQKGLLAIARKQLSTKEAEKAKFEKEHEESVAEVTSITEEKQSVEKEIADIDAFMASPPPPKTVASPAPSTTLSFAAAQPLPATPEVPLSPVSTIKSNNPFERLAMGGGQSTPMSPLGLSNTIISTPVLTPPIASEDAAQPEKASVNPDDIFSFGDDHEHEHQADDHELSYLKTDSPAPQENGLSSPPDTSNGTDFFMTPPTSAVNDTSSPNTVAERFPSLGDISTQALDDTAATHTNGSAAPAAAAPAPADAPKASEPEEKHAETDLGAQLKEIEVEESDSDEESDDDDKPLAQVFAANGHGGQMPTSPAKDTQAPQAAAAPAAAPVSFDDVFGSDEPAAETKRESKGPFDLPAASADHSLFSANDDKPTIQAPPVAGVNEFDEALGKVPSTTTAAPAPAFSFDDAFEDSFDFASASKAVETAPVAANTQAVQQDKGKGRSGDLGEASPWTVPAPAPSASNNAPTFDSTFDDAFKTFDAIGEPKPEAVKLAPAPMHESPASSPFSSSFSQPAPKQPTPIPSSPRVVEPAAAPSLPPRAKSPPPRVASPKLRVGSTSSKESPADKSKETKHSKLSIRLPFGKKKKHSEPQPAPQPAAQHLSPPMEEVGWASNPGTPGNDDVEPVKQLTAMGFSRAQAVDALEAQAYDVQKALNMLLGQ